MIRKALAAAGLVALAAGPALATAAPASAATSATTAAKPGYVAIVISGHGTYCVQWTSGITGDTVLNKVARVGYRSDGLIVTIDGDPSSGTADDTHFWSYWHDTTSSWAYSNVGASNYDPPAGSVEGWSYDDGQADPPAPSQNPSGLYGSLCGRYDTAATGRGGATSAPVVKRTTATRTSAPRSSAARPAPSRRASSAFPARSGASSTNGTASSAPATGSRATSSPPDVIAGGSGSPGGGSSAPGSISASPAASTSSSGSPTGLIVGIGLVVVLGAGAGAVALRRRGAGG